MATPDMDPKAKGTQTPKPLAGSDPVPAPGQPPTSAAKTASEPNELEQAAGKRASEDAQKAADEAAKRAQAIARGEVAPVIPPDPGASDEAAAVAEFGVEEGLNDAEAGLLRAILQARRDGTQVPSNFYGSLSDDRIAAVGEASDKYVEARSASATGTDETEPETDLTDPNLTDDQRAKAKAEAESKAKADAEAKRN